MLKSLSKLFAFIVAFVNIFFYYIWGAIFYISTAISHIFSFIPVISFIGALVSFLGSILGRLILYLWLVFDYVILFLRELVMPFLVSVFTFFGKIFFWIWEKMLWFIRLFIPECKPSEKWCVKFDKKISYGISLLKPTEIMEANRHYEDSLRMHYKNKLKEFYVQQNIDLNQMYNKAYKSRRNSDMFAYNRALQTMQIAELNIQNNYALSIDQHRLILFRNNENILFDKILPLQTQALHFSTLSDKVPF